MKLTIKQIINKTKSKPTNNINKAYQLQTTITQQTYTKNLKKNTKKSKVEVVSSSMHLEVWFCKHEKDQIKYIWVGGVGLGYN